MKRALLVYIARWKLKDCRPYLGKGDSSGECKKPGERTVKLTTDDGTQAGCEMEVY